MVFRTHEARVAQGTQGTKLGSGRIAASSCVVVSIRFLRKLLRSWQIEILE